MKMTKTEHRVSVESGKYTFVVPADDYRVSILRYGEPWHGPQGEASNALHQLMMELDAARVVVGAVRAARERFGEPRAPQIPPSIIDALARHDSLVDDCESPSAWCGESSAEPQTESAAPATCDCALLQSRISALETRQQELLQTIVRLTNDTPFPDEIKGWEAQRAAMVAEVGSLRARVAELERAEESPAAPAGYVTNRRIAEIARSAARATQLVELSVVVNTQDLRLIVTELQRRRAGDRP